MADKQTTKPDPWADDPSMAAQPGQATASGDNDDWKIWTQGADVKPQPGFLQNLGHAFGIGEQEDKQQQDDFSAHPIRTIAEDAMGPGYAVAKGAVSGLKRIGGELAQGGKALAEGNPASAAVHGIAAIPLVGPALNKMADEAPASQPGQSYLSKVWDDATPGNVGTALGTAAQVAPAVLGGADMAAPDRPLLAEIPTRAKAGAKFQQVMQKAGDQPVWMRNAGPELNRALELADRGGTKPTPVSKLAKRVGNVNNPPLTYQEARDFATNLSDLSADEKMALKPVMRRQVGKLSRAFNQDVGDTATAAGVGDQYTQAMRDYARAANNREMAIKAAKWVGLPAGGAAAATMLKKAFQ